MNAEAEQKTSFLDRGVFQSVYQVEHEECFKAVFTYANTAIKAAIVSNGAAAIATLTFLGNVLGKDKPLPLIGAGQSMVWPLVCFVAGSQWLAPSLGQPI